MASTTSDVYPSPTPVRLGSVPAGSEEGLGFIQQRLALFGKVTGLTSLTFLVIGPLLDRMHTGFFTSGSLWHLVATLLLLGVWAVARLRVRLSARSLVALDGGGVVGACVAFGAMGWAYASLMTVYIMLLASTLIVIARAIVVPSVPGRTLWISVASLLPVPIVAWMQFQGELAVFPLGPTLAVDPMMRNGAVASLGLWVAAATVVAVLASRTIFGLHEKVRQVRQLGQYTLARKIGEGGMGEVYLARHAMLRRPTAVKLLRSEATGGPQLERFEREVQLTSLLSHPNTIAIYDYGRTPDGVCYYAMEYLAGVNLERLVRIDGPQRAGRVIHLLRQTCGALAEAHAVGLIHRDIKPANIVLTERGGMPDVAKVLDFGLVKQVKGLDPDLTKSRVDVVVGTPHYMSPEAMRTPEAVGPRSDLYAVGAVGYFLLTGSTVFDGVSVLDICSQHLTAEPVPPSRRARASVPTDLEAVILSCLAKKPEDRPVSARAVCDELGRCADAAAWTEAEARQWWEAHRELLAGTDRPAARGGQEDWRTIDIDIESRLAGVQTQ